MNVFPTRCVLWNRVQLSNIIIALRSNALFADGLQLKHESGLANACVPMLVTAIATAFQLKALRLHWTIRPIGANGKSISQKAPSQYSNEAHFFSTLLIVFFCVCTFCKVCIIVNWIDNGLAYWDQRLNVQLDLNTLQFTWCDNCYNMSCFQLVLFFLIWKRWHNLLLRLSSFTRLKRID